MPEKTEVMLEGPPSVIDELTGNLMNEFMAVEVMGWHYSEGSWYDA